MTFNGLLVVLYVLGAYEAWKAEKGVIIPSDAPDFLKKNAKLVVGVVAALWPFFSVISLLMDLLKRTPDKHDDL